MKAHKPTTLILASVISLLAFSPAARPSTASDLMYEREGNEMAADRKHLPAAVCDAIAQLYRLRRPGPLETPAMAAPRAGLCNWKIEGLRAQTWTPQLELEFQKLLAQANIEAAKPDKRPVIIIER